MENRLGDFVIPATERWNPGLTRMSPDALCEPGCPRTAGLTVGKPSQFGAGDLKGEIHVHS